jgi:hypothetical protein
LSSTVKIGAAVGFVLLAAQIVLLVMQLGVLRNSHAHIVAQDAKARELLDTTRPVARDAGPLIKDARGLVKPIKQQGGQIVRATDVLPGLALAARQLISDSAPLIDAANRLVSEALRRDVISTAERTAADVDKSVRIQQETLEIQRRAISVQERTLRAQLEGLRIQREGVAVARETLKHAESIDRKTGGPLPTP